jgi:probable rRNA maturation factor
MGRHRRDRIAANSHDMLHRKSEIRNPKSKIGSPSYSIAIANQQRVMRIDRRRLARLARAVLSREHVARAEISVAVVDDPQIHAINRKFLNHDCPTDVISFLLDGDDAAKGWRRRRRGSGKSIGGEIVISAQTARRSARDFKTIPEDELELYLVHGLLHLCGYDDRTPPEKRLMRRREAEALSEWNADQPRRARRSARLKKN